MTTWCSVCHHEPAESGSDLGARCLQLQIELDLDQEDVDLDDIRPRWPAIEEYEIEARSGRIVERVQPRSEFL